MIDQKKSREDLIQELEELRQQLRASGTGLWSFVDNKNHWDQRTLEIFEQTVVPETYDDFLALVHPDDRAHISPKPTKAGYAESQYRVLLADGSNKWLLSRSKVLLDEAGEFRGLKGIVIDLSEQKQMEERLKAQNIELEALATVDALTGIPNRRYFDQLLNRSWQQAVRSNQPLSCLMIDVDKFKLYNDRFGHAFGDEILVAVANALSSSIYRISDYVARYGGDEFVAICVNTDATAAMTIAERIRSSIAMLAIPQTDNADALNITISVGVSTMSHTSTSTARDLLNMADRALLRAKADGRNRVYQNS